MPKIPIFNARTYGGGVDFGRLGPEAYGAGAFRGIAGLGAVLQDAQLQQDDIDVKKRAVDLDNYLDALKEAVKTEPDFVKREKLYRDKAGEYLKTQVDSVESDNVKAGLNQYFSIKFAREATKFSVQNQKDWDESRVAQTMNLADDYANRIINTDDPREIAKFKSLYVSQLATLTQGPYAPRTETWRQQQQANFEKEIANRRANKRSLATPELFLAETLENDGKVEGLADDEAIKYVAQARREMERQDTARDKVAREVKGIVMDRWQARANSGSITPEESAALLSGNVTGITPAEARTLVNVNSEPPMSGGSGSLSVQALAAEYYLRPRSIGNINTTRAKLRALQNDLGRPDPLINKLANELQSDQTTLENQGIAREGNEIQRQNREVKQIQTEYDADKPQTPKALQTLLGNQDAQNKAKIEAEYRRNGAEAARKLRDQLSKGQKAKTDSIKEKHDAAIGW